MITGQDYGKIMSAPDRREIMRYMGCLSDDERARSLIDECLPIILPKLSPRACADRLSVTVEGEEIFLGGKILKGRSLASLLCECDEAVIFAATVGLDADRLIAAYSHTSPSRALCMQAIATERVECLCDTVEKEIKRLCHADITRRFSPGYGDLPLTAQRDICELTDCARRVGLTLKENLILSPSKSVTAIVGIKK